MLQDKYQEHEKRRRLDWEIDRLKDGWIDYEMEIEKEDKEIHIELNMNLVWRKDILQIKTSPSTM